MEERENIRERLKKHKLSYVWLIGQLALRGIVTDKTEMSSVISGTRNGTKADAIIELSIFCNPVVCNIHGCVLECFRGFYAVILTREPLHNVGLHVLPCLFAVCF